MTDPIPLSDERILGAITALVNDRLQTDCPHPVQGVPLPIPLLALLISQRQMHDLSRMADALENIAAFYEKGLS